MSKPLPRKDFRATRFILEPNDFAIPPSKGRQIPSDLIDQEIWNSIMHLPEDVSIRTTNHEGTSIRYQDQLCDAWLNAIGDEKDMIFDAMLDANDEFNAMLFNSIHGYYRQAIGCLRNALELMTIGTCYQVLNDQVNFKSWRSGNEKNFGVECANLDKADKLQSLNQHLLLETNDTLFKGPKGPNGGWARRLYHEICHYSHSRALHTNIDMWQSNGPIFVSEVFSQTAELFFETSALCYVCVKIARPQFVLPEMARSLFTSDGHEWSQIAQCCYLYLFGV